MVSQKPSSRSVCAFPLDRMSVMMMFAISLSASRLRLNEVDNPKNRILTLIVVYCVLAIGRFFVVVMCSADLYSAQVDIGSQINNAKSIILT